MTSTASKLTGDTGIKAAPRQRIHALTERRIKELSAIAGELGRLVDKPALQVSIRDVKNKIGELREMVSRLVS